jgi:hypothetical protein
MRELVGTRRQKMLRLRRLTIEKLIHLRTLKWMKKEEAINIQHIWERGDNEMRNWKTSTSWQNDTTELSRTND